MLTILQQPGEISLSRNQMLLSFRALDGSSQPYSDVNPAPGDYKILLDIYFEPTYLSGSFESIVSLDLYIDSASEVIVDISSILHAALEEALPELQIPAFDAAVPFKADILRQFYFRYRESFEGVSEVWTDSTNRLVLCGGISQALFAAGDFFGSLNELNSLLSWYPLSKTVSADQPEWLAWFNHTGSTNEIALQVFQYSADSSLPTSTFAFSESTLNATPNEVVLIPCGPTQLGVSSNTLKYVVRVVDQANTNITLSQKKNFYIDRLQYRSSRFVMYLNSFHLPETLRCVGVFELALEISRQDRRRVLTDGYSPTSPETFQYDQSYQQVFTYRSGYLSKKEVESLQELLIYNKIYEVSSLGSIPLHLNEKKFRITTTGDILSSLQFKAIRSQRQLSFGLDYQLLQPGSPDRAYSNGYSNGFQ